MHIASASDSYDLFSVSRSDGKIVSSFEWGVTLKPSDLGCLIRGKIWGKIASYSTGNTHWTSIYGWQMKSHNTKINAAVFIHFQITHITSDRKSDYIDLSFSKLLPKSTLFSLPWKVVLLGSGKTFSDQKATVQRHQKTLFFAQTEWFYSALQKLTQNLMQT